MITLPDKSFKSSIRLSQVYGSMTKVNMLKICKKLDIYVSPNLHKDKTAARVAEAVLDDPISVLYALSKNELELLDEFVKAGANQYIVRKERKTAYMLQKLGLVVTYIDDEKGEWHMLMPDSVREALAPNYALYLKVAQNGGKGPSPRDLRMMSALGHLYDEK